MVIFSQFPTKSFLQHFHLALYDTSVSSLSQLEIKFHIGHLYETRGDLAKAKESYESILASENLPPKVSFSLKNIVIEKINCQKI